MRRVGLALALAALAAAAPWVAGFASAAGEPEGFAPGAVLTPTELGITDPAQGFNPYFPSTGNSLGNNFGVFPLGGFNGCGAFSVTFCPFFSAAPYWSTFSQVGGTLGIGAGLGSSVFFNPYFNSRFGLGGLGFGGGGIPFTGAVIVR
jgi:hypothetical protein